MKFSVKFRGKEISDGFIFCTKSTKNETLPKKSIIFKANKNMRFIIKSTQKLNVSTGSTQRHQKLVHNIPFQICADHATVNKQSSTFLL